MNVCLTSQQVDCVDKLSFLVFVQLCNQQHQFTISIHYSAHRGDGASNEVGGTLNESR